MTDLVLPHTFSDSAINTRHGGLIVSPKSSHNAGSMSTSGDYCRFNPSQYNATCRPFPRTARGMKPGCLPKTTRSMIIEAFVANLAHMFDTTDRDRRFTLVVPHRAMFSPVPLYAIYTASARHLTRLSQRDDRTQMVQFEGIPLPGLDERTAIRYHNVCISYLVAISNDPEQDNNDDALTATTILRSYE